MTLESRRRRWHRRRRCEAALQSGRWARIRRVGNPHGADIAVRIANHLLKKGARCSKVNAGCKHCYAEVMARRLQAMGQPNYRNGFAVTLQPHMLNLPLRWRKPQTIFVNSMSDLFHPEVPLDYIERVFAVMRRAHWHRFQVLTKRSGRLAEVADALAWPANVWMGVSIENEAQQVRADDLRSTGAAVKFLSLEPLLGPLPNLNLSQIDWVIVGGESGPGARAMRPEWVLQLRDRCELANVPFFFKQWGGVHKKRAGRTLDGRTWDQMPLTLSARGSAIVDPLDR